MRSTVDIRLLGRFSARRDGREIALGRGKLAKLLRVMACSRGEFVSREVLAEALWGERQPKDPDAAIEVLVSRVRRALGDPGIIVTGPGGYSVDTSRCIVDIDTFSASATRGRDQLAAGRSDEALRAFEDALGLWGDPLAEDAYEEWAQPVRRELSSPAPIWPRSKAVPRPPSVAKTGRWRSISRSEPARSSRSPTRPRRC